MNFEEALNTTDPIFESIIQVMILGRCDSAEVNNARKYLMVVNNVIDFYLSRQDDVLKIPIIYFPLCTESAQKLCEEFVTIKLGLFSNNEWKETFTQILQQGINGGWHIKSDENTPTLIKLSLKNYRYEEKLYEVLSCSNSIAHEAGNSFIYSDYLLGCYKKHKAARGRHNNLTAYRYWYLSKSINGDYRRESDHPLSLISGDHEQFYDYILDKLGNRKIHNFFIFPLGNVDGNYSRFCSEVIQSANLNDFVTNGSGLKNVFIFCFSKKPYRLHRQIDFKSKMRTRLHVFDDNTIDYITFSYEESAYLFSQRMSNICRTSIGQFVSDDYTDFEIIFDSIIDDINNYSLKILRRNEASMCITQEMADFFYTKISADKEIDDIILSQIFTINKELWEETTNSLLSNFLNNEPNVCVITRKGVDEHLKELFKNWICQMYNIQDVQYATFVDLQGRIRDGVYKNSIASDRIIILSFKDFVAYGYSPQYPNSFDPICTNEGQKVLVLSNYFIMGQYYDYGWYNYNKSLYNILKSDFRHEKMRPSIERPSTPDTNRTIIEEDYDEYNNRNNTNQQITITYTDLDSRSFNRNEWMLYKYDNYELSIGPLSELKEQYSGSFERLTIQPISDLVKIINEEYIEKRKEEDTISERLFKKQAIYNLSDDQIKNGVQLWKLLLQRKINESSIESVYNEFTSHYKISLSSFSKWPNDTYGLPRSNKMQAYLIKDFLGIRDPYLKIVRRLKARSRNNTENTNTIIRHFLYVALTSDDFSEAITTLGNETTDLLGLDNESDVQALVSLVQERINLEPIKNICYD